MSSPFLEDLEYMRNKYWDNPLDDLDLPRPKWMDDKDEKLSTLYLEKKTLLQKGKIVYGAMVMANARIFKSFPRGDYPGVIIYSDDPFVDEHPKVLYNVANEIYEFKDDDSWNVPKEYRHISKILTDEVDRSSFDFTVDIYGHHTFIQGTSTMFFRKLLPKGKLCGKLIPVLMEEGCTNILTLPKEYWPEDFRRAWEDGLI